MYRSRPTYGRPDAWAPRHRHALVTALLTALLAGGFALGIAHGQIIVRDDGRGLRRLLPFAGAWRALLDHLPAHAPALLERGPLLALLGLATLVAAYLLIATLRLPE